MPTTLGFSFERTHTHTHTHPSTVPTSYRQRDGFEASSPIFVPFTSCLLWPPPPPTFRHPALFCNNNFSSWQWNWKDSYDTTWRPTTTDSVVFKNVWQAQIYLISMEPLIARWTPNRNFLINHLKCLVSIWMCRTHTHTHSTPLRTRIKNRIELCAHRCVALYRNCRATSISIIRRRSIAQRKTERKNDRRRKKKNRRME